MTGLVHSVIRLADGVPEVRKAAREQLREGADMFKIFTTGGVMSERDKPTACQYSMDEIRAFVEEAKNAGVRAGTHALGTQGIKNAVLAGIDNVDHGVYLDDEVIELMAVVCATRNNAIVLGLQDEIGTLEAGKQADLIFIDGDPLADISVLRDRDKILAVYKGGQAASRMPF